MKKLLYIFLVLSAVTGYAQSVILDPSQTTILDAQGTDKTARIPLVSAAQRAAIVAPSIGSMVYDTDYQTVFLFDGQRWSPILFTTTVNALPPINRTASDGAFGDRFGSSVAISGDYAIVGAPKNNSFSSQGAAYIFVRSGGTWVEQAKLIGDDGNHPDGFGISVSVSSDYAMVGTKYAIGGSGSVYIFARSGTTWTQQAKFLYGDRAAFTTNVSISNDYAIVGIAEQSSNNYAGTAYIYARTGTTWSLQSSIQSADHGTMHNFGCSVSISGDYAVVGAYNSDQNASMSGKGSAYVFNRSGTTWTQQAKLMASDGDYGDSFGNAVSISGDYAIVGAFRDDNGVNFDQGSAYIFTRSGSTWTEQAKLTASDGLSGDYFGRAVSISGDNVIVGASGDDIGANIDQGSAYVFTRSGTNWIPVRQVIDASDMQPDRFGASAGITPTGSFIIGAPDKNLGKGSVSFGKVGN